ncbi:hypothetical protein ES288_A13G081900v1 [Gossypium darwinii]|uniref:Uncharacterized protein n=1 Tax=Gossypium darwinii TaxID=34276 RepID=A0A5D2DXX1_GOSDA|nr:hypothetical protein ES288_A13G081900v1 [Gossypium darwinii]
MQKGLNQMAQEKRRDREQKYPILALKKNMLPFLWPFKPFFFIFHFNFYFKKEKRKQRAFTLSPSPCSFRLGFLEPSSPPSPQRHHRRWLGCKPGFQAPI